MTENTLISGRRTVPPGATCWVTVRTDALFNNVAQVRAFITERSPTGQLIAVVKANAYGHGLVESAAIAQRAGADMLAVTNSEEAMLLRSAGNLLPILQFLPPSPDCLEILIRSDVVLTVGNQADVSNISAFCRDLGLSARVHLKVDTGMGRFGEMPEQALRLATQLADNKHITLAGVYTHCANATHRDVKHIDQQYAVFDSFLNSLTSAGISAGTRHFSNSAAMLRRPEYLLDAARVGTLLYGQYPGPTVPRTLQLSDTWELAASVVSVREMPAGTPVGYGSEFVTRRKSRIAVLGVGFAHGFTVAPASTTRGIKGALTIFRSQFLGHKISVKISGQSVPIVGRVAMQTCMVDVTDFPNVQAGDVAIVPTRRISTPADIVRVYEGNG